MHSAFVEEAGKWVTFPGEAQNMLLELLHANEWFGLEESDLPIKGESHRHATTRHHDVTYAKR